MLEGIKTPALDAVKTRILSDADLRSDFDACVNLIQDFIEQKGDTVRDVTIAGLKTGNNKGQDQAQIEPDMTVEDRYYNKKEYAKLTNAQKYGLKLKRQKRQKDKKRKDTSTPDKMELSDKSIKSLVAALKTGNTEDESSVETESDDSSTEEDSDPKTRSKSKKNRFSKETNRTNKALFRNGKK